MFRRSNPAIPNAAEAKYGDHLPISAWRANMPCEIVEREGGRITFKVRGLLKKAELDQAQKIAIKDIQSGNKIRLLVLVENFLGWDNQDDWGDVSFQLQYDEQIERIAIVCDKQWQEMAEVFMGKGLRSVDIRHFTPSQAALAKAWIQ
jgi:hypothetical protein